MLNRRRFLKRLFGAAAAAVAAIYCPVNAEPEPWVHIELSVPEIVAAANDQLNRAAN